MGLMKYLRNDEELNQMREQWKAKFTESFPPYNYDEYYGIDDYKSKIRMALETGDFSQAHREVTKFDNISSTKNIKKHNENQRA